MCEIFVKSLYLIFLYANLVNSCENPAMLHFTSDLAKKTAESRIFKYVNETKTYSAKEKNQFSIL